VTQVTRTIQASEGGIFDMAHEFWINSILSGFLTQAANVVGNTLNAAWTLGLKRSLEATVNDLFLHSADMPHLREYGYMLRAAIPAITRAWGNALYAWSTETSRYQHDILEIQLSLNSDTFDDRDNHAPAIGGKVLGIGTYGGRSLPGAIAGAITGKGWSGVDVGKTIRIPGPAWCLSLPPTPAARVPHGACPCPLPRLHGRPCGCVRHATRDLCSANRRRAIPIRSVLRGTNFVLPPELRRA
jgi:hypothetical protein